MVERDAVRRGYDELGSAYAAQRELDGREAGIVERFLETLPDSPRVLDAGCGRGHGTLSRLPPSADGLGIDVSRRQVHGAAETVPGAALAQGDLTRLPAADGVADAVTALHSLIHVPLAEHDRAIAEFARVLRPGGRLLVSEGPAEWRGSNPDWLGAGAEMQWAIAGADATREQLRAAGFRVTDERSTADSDDEESWVVFSATLDAGGR